VLIDDVLTSGGHLRAAAAFVRDHGLTVAIAVCAGKADNDPSAWRTHLLREW